MPVCLWLLTRVLLTLSRTHTHRYAIAAVAQTLTTITPATLTPMMLLLTFSGQQSSLWSACVRVRVVQTQLHTHTRTPTFHSLPNRGNWAVRVPRGPVAGAQPKRHAGRQEGAQGLRASICTVHLTGLINFFYIHYDFSRISSRSRARLHTCTESHKKACLA